jgi:hypothetical protein
MRLPAAFRQRAFALSLIAFMVVWVLWNVPALDFITYPLRLFVTFIHEAGHGLAALITGGRFLTFEIFRDGSGVATTAGGSPLLVLPAGYLGTALFGSILFYLANRLPYPKIIAGVLGVSVLLIALRFGGLFSIAGVVGIVMGVLLIALAWRGHADLTLLVLNVLAVIVGLNAVLDLFFLVNNSSISAGQVRNDAAAFQAAIAPLIPAFIWAGLWALTAAGMLGAAIYFSLIKGWGER